MSVVRSFVLVTLLCSGLSAQGIFPTLEVTPNPATPGQLLQVKIVAPRDFGIQYQTDANGRPCGFVHADSINGAATCFPPQSCNSGFSTLSPCQTLMGFIPSCTTPGLHALGFRYRDPGGTPLTVWACYRIDSTGMEPALRSIAPPQVGQSWMLEVSAPFYVGNTYALAFSFASTAGISAGSLDICLDWDFLFSLSISATPPPGLFNNIVGGVGVSGLGSGIQFNIPNIPQLGCLPLRAQAIVGPFTPNPQMTNQVAFSIRP